MKVKHALEKIEHVLSDERFAHTVRVLKVAEKIADHYDVDTKQVQLAAIFHDYAKEMSAASLKQYIVKHKLDQTLLHFNKELWHGPVASHIVQHEFGIQSTSTLNAIYYHTTGRANMDMVELVLFVADYIEPERNFPGLDGVKEVVYSDLHKAAFLTLKNTIPYLIKKEATIFPDTFHAYNDLNKHATGGNE